MISKVKVNVVAILFGRKGSSGFPGKNLYPVLGRPATVYPLLAAKHSKYMDKIYTSTDDPEIARISKENFDTEIIERPPELCTSEALVEDAMVHAYLEVKRRLGYAPSYVVILLCNACNIVSEAIDRGVEVLEKNSYFDSATTVCIYNMFAPIRARCLAPDGSMQPLLPLEVFGDPTSLNSRRDLTGDTYFADGGMTVVRGFWLEKIEDALPPFRWMGRRIYPIVQEPGGGDIDYEWQVAATEHWLRKHGFTEKSTPYGGSY